MTCPFWTSVYLPIQVLSYNSLVLARQNVSITSVLTNCTLGSWKDIDVNLSLIGYKEMIWKTCFDSSWRFSTQFWVTPTSDDLNNCRRIFSKLELLETRLTFSHLFFFCWNTKCKWTFETDCTFMDTFRLVHIQHQTGKNGTLTGKDAIRKYLVSFSLNVFFA